MSIVPFRLHPTTVAIVDDDPDLLDSLRLELIDHFKCECFSSPSKCLDYLAKNFKLQKSAKKHYLNVSYQGSLSISLGVKFDTIYSEVKDKNRFKGTIILIVDYNMPELNGLAFIQQIKQKKLPVKIIMLTGVADQQTAVDAFNKKEIDRFVVKTSPDYYIKLLEYINELQLEYFSERNLAISESVKTLQDNDFVDLFNKIYHENNIVEYYLLDDSGSFLMYDAKGNPTWLIVHTEEDMQMYRELASDEEDISESLLHAIEKKKNIVTYAKRGGVIPPVKDWTLHPAKKLGNSEIYYCVLKDANVYQLKIGKIYTYQEFLQS